MRSYIVAGCIASVVGLGVSASANACSQANASSVSVTSTGETILLAADAVRKVPKEKEKEKEIPKLPESAIPGAKNPGGNYDPPKGSTDTNKGGGVKDVKTPTVEDGKCKGSANCSKLFDGGK